MHHFKVIVLSIFHLKKVTNMNHHSSMWNWFSLCEMVLTDERECVCIIRCSLYISYRYPIYRDLMFREILNKTFIFSRRWFITFHIIYRFFYFHLILILEILQKGSRRLFTSLITWCLNHKLFFETFPNEYRDIVLNLSWL